MNKNVEDIKNSEWKSNPKSHVDYIVKQLLKKYQDIDFIESISLQDMYYTGDIEDIDSTKYDRSNKDTRVITYTVTN